MGSYQECLDLASTFHKQVDIDGNNFIDRCEDAKFLKGIGNTEHYSLHFASSRSLPQIQQICKYVIIDAFDEPMDIEKDTF